MFKELKEIMSKGLKTISEYKYKDRNYKKGTK